MQIDITALWALVATIVAFALLATLKRRFKVGFGARTLIATGLGIVIGVAFGQGFSYYAIFGTIYANVISALVVPLLLFSIISSITNLTDLVHLRGIGVKSVIFLVLNTLTATLLTLAIALPLGVGTGFSLDGVTYEAKEVPTVTDTIVGLFPQNLAAAWTSNAVVPIIVFATIVALAYNRLASERQDGEKVDVRPFKAFIDAGNKVLGETVS